jgi:membrane protein YdbS with pleckstrin-like domain
MKKIVSFLRWEFRGCTQSLSFWGAIVVVLGIIMWAAGCPNPWPLYAIVVGFAMNFVDLVYAWIRFRVAMFKIDQESLARKLQDQ